MVTSDFRPEVEIRPFRACAMHPGIIIGTVRSLWTSLWDSNHVPQNVFLVYFTKFLLHHARHSATTTLSVVSYFISLYFFLSVSTVSCLCVDLLLLF